MLKRGIYLYNHYKLKEMSIVKSQNYRITVNFVAVLADNLRIFNPCDPKRRPNQDNSTNFMKQSKGISIKLNKVKIHKIFMKLPR